MTKCYYCEFEYETEMEFKDHLNDRHVRCMFCSNVLDKRTVEDKTCVCPECSEKEFE